MDLLFTHFFAFSLGIAVPSSYAYILWSLDYLSSLLHQYLNVFRSRQPLRSNSTLLKDVHVELFDRHQIAAHFAEHTWQRQAHEAFVAQLQDPQHPFPCIYGTKAHKANELDYLFLPSEDLLAPDIPHLAAKGILAYHARARAYPRGRDRTTSLVLLAAPPPTTTSSRSVDDYHRLFWSFLRRLRALDPAPWPRDTTQDTASERWCFHFDGTPAFIAVMTPAHRRRRSRHAANLCMVYQPRYVFDAVFPTGKSRARATRTVRALVDGYDAIPHSPDISDYGSVGTTESRQYFLLDENETAECPYRSLEGTEMEGGEVGG